jgi:hypothetical protein
VHAFSVSSAGVSRTGVARRHESQGSLHPHTKHPIAPFCTPMRAPTSTSTSPGFVNLLIYFANSQFLRICLKRRLRPVQWSEWLSGKSARSSESEPSWCQARSEASGASEGSGCRSTVATSHRASSGPGRSVARLSNGASERPLKSTLRVASSADQVGVLRVVPAGQSCGSANVCCAAL